MRSSRQLCAFSRTRDRRNGCRHPGTYRDYQCNKNGLFAGYFSAFTVLNNEVLFSGVDAAGNQGLWVTNGTTVGTHELTGISGAFPDGLFDGINADLVGFKKEAVFAGLDANNGNGPNQYGLWVTNGTAAFVRRRSGQRRRNQARTLRSSWTYSTTPLSAVKLAADRSETRHRPESNSTLRVTAAPAAALSERRAS